MATIGLAGDVNNSIFMTNAYPYGRSYGMVGMSGSDFAYRNNYAGEIGGLNSDFQYGGATFAATAVNPNMPAGASRVSGQAQHSFDGNGQVTKKPAMWFLGFFAFFIVFLWLAYRYAPDGEQYALIKPNLINFAFVGLFVILLIVLFKQIAIRIKPVPGLSHLADLILSV
jgi:hypothetical protein